MDLIEATKRAIQGTLLEGVEGFNAKEFKARHGIKNLSIQADTIPENIDEIVDNLTQLYTGTIDVLGRSSDIKKYIIGKKKVLVQAGDLPYNYAYYEYKTDKFGLYQVWLGRLDAGFGKLKDELDSAYHNAKGFGYDELMAIKQFEKSLIAALQSKYDVKQVDMGYCIEGSSVQEVLDALKGTMQIVAQIGQKRDFSDFQADIDKYDAEKERIANEKSAKREKTRQTIQDRYGLSDYEINVVLEEYLEDMDRSRAFYNLIETCSGQFGLDWDDAKSLANLIVRA